MRSTTSKLILETGDSFSGSSPSEQKTIASGEVVFTTGMTGYVESLTDPSYADQILVFTYPLIGNYGVPDPKTWESKKVHAAGVVICELSPTFSHYNAEKHFLHWLEEQGASLITNVDTRSLTQRLRKEGVALGAICLEGHEATTFHDPQADYLIQKVSISEKQRCKTGKKRLIAVDFGMKENLMRSLLEFDWTIDRVPYDYDYSKEEYDGLFLSNGPGNPQLYKDQVKTLKSAMEREKPIFGVCLGAQLLGLASGADIFKLKFGHRSQNQPCMDLETRRCILTSQNHGWAIQPHSLPKDWKVLFENLNDQTVEGIAHKTLPFSAVQFHPESNPGPMDSEYLFERFCKQVCHEKRLKKF